MAEENKEQQQQQAAAAAPQQQQFDMKALSAAIGENLKSAIEAANKPLLDAIAKLQAPAPAAEADAKKTDAPKPLTAEDVASLLDQKLTERATKAQAAADIQAKRATFLTEKNPKLIGTPFEAMLGEDPAKFDEQLGSIVAGINKVVPAADFGNANKGGGDTADKKQEKPALNPNLPEGVAKFAAAITTPAAAQ